MSDDVGTPRADRPPNMEPPPSDPRWQALSPPPSLVYSEDAPPGFVYSGELKDCQWTMEWVWDPLITEGIGGTVIVPRLTARWTLNCHVAR